MIQRNAEQLMERTGIDLADMTSNSKSSNQNFQTKKVDIAIHKGNNIGQLKENTVNNAYSNQKNEPWKDLIFNNDKQRQGKEVILF